MNIYSKMSIISIATVLLLSTSHAADRSFAPIAEHPVRVYFSDPHLHTSLSMDAGAWGYLIHSQVKFVVLILCALAVALLQYGK